MAADPERIVVVSGVARAAALPGSVLHARGPREIAVADPDSPRHDGLYEAAGTRAVPLPLDDEGLALRPPRKSGVRAVVTTPAHQYPTGIAYSADRRTQLLDRAPFRTAGGRRGGGGAVARRVRARAGRRVHRTAGARVRASAAGADPGGGAADGASGCRVTFPARSVVHPRFPCALRRPSSCGGAQLAGSRPGGPSMTLSLPGRRSVLRGSLAASAALTLPTALGSAPAFALSGRPRADWGVQAGDVTAGSGLVWVRSDRPARMIVETSATESFRNARRWHGPLLGSGSDFTGTTRLHGLPSGEQIHYRVLLADPDDPRRTGEPVAGTFRTASARRRQGVKFVWSGDLAGQGWGINESIGGYRIFDAMAKLDPDFFLCSGDNIYADGVISATQALPDGSLYRNVTSEEKSHVAVTLDDFRGNFRYNLLDQALRRFNAQVPPTGDGPRGGAVWDRTT
ncbi:alkaline phosphatase D family protein, partial [Streptomyces sp. NPDC005921]